MPQRFPEIPFSAENGKRQNMTSLRRSDIPPNSFGRPIKASTNITAHVVQSCCPKSSGKFCDDRCNPVGDIERNQTEGSFVPLHGPRGLTVAPNSRPSLVDSQRCVPQPWLEPRRRGTVSVARDALLAGRGGRVDTWITSE